MRQREEREEKEQKKKKSHKGLTVLAVVVMILLAVGIFAAATRLTSVTVTGSTRYSEEELISMIFKEDRDWNTFYALYKDRFGKKEDIPFIQKYQVKVTGLHSASVTVYEKSIAGCMEYMGAYLYFDKDGIIVESSGEHDVTVPLITGLKFQNVVMYEKLTVSDEEIFPVILNLSQLLSGYGIETKEVNFDNSGNITLYVGNIKAVLGSSQYLAEKISEFRDMLVQISGLSGTLYLDEYTPDAKNPSYPFIQTSP